MSSTHNIINPISEQEQQAVIAQTQYYINKALTEYNLKDKPVDIVFNLTGRTSGMYRVSHNKTKCKREIRYNPYIFSKYYDDNFNNTIPHEVAHYITDLLYGLKNIKPHGQEWKMVMQAFSATPTVTADYDLSGIPQKKITSYFYQCECREHTLSAIRHNKIKKKGYKYYCTFCKTPLYIKE